MSILCKSHGGIWTAMLRAFCTVSLALGAASQALAAKNCGELRDQVRRSIVFVKVDRKNDDGSPPVSVTGTGFIATESGIIVTAGHLIPDDLKNAEAFASIGSQGEHAYPLTYIGKDPQTDVALLQLRKTDDSKSLPMKALGDERWTVKLCVFGFPYGEDLAFAPGEITDDRKTLGRWQMSAPINPGYSGGPVMLTSGEVVGMAWGGAASAQAMTYMVPASQLEQILKPYDPGRKADKKPIPETPIRLNVSVPTIKGNDNIYPVHLTMSAPPSRPNLWVVAEDTGGDVWPQRQVSRTQPRFTLTISKTSGFPLSVYVIAVDKDASQEIKRLAASDKAITIGPDEYDIVSNIETIEQ